MKRRILTGLMLACLFIIFTYPFTEESLLIHKKSVILFLLGVCLGSLYLIMGSSHEKTGEAGPPSPSLHVLDSLIAAVFGTATYLETGKAGQAAIIAFATLSLTLLFRKSPWLKNKERHRQKSNPGKD